MADGPEWPAVEPGLLGHLQSIFVTPLRLDAAFDSEAECNELITCSFPDIVDESKLDAVALLMDWKERSERSLKRLRKSVVAENLFRLQQPDSISVQEQFQHITKTSVHCILEMHSKRRQRKYKEDPPDIRLRRFDAGYGQGKFASGGPCKDVGRSSVCMDPYFWSQER